MGASSYLFVLPFRSPSSSSLPSSSSSSSGPLLPPPFPPPLVRLLFHLLLSYDFSARLGLAEIQRCTKQSISPPTLPGNRSPERAASGNVLVLIRGTLEVALGATVSNCEAVVRPRRSIGSETASCRTVCDIPYVFGDFQIPGESWRATGGPLRPSGGRVGASWGPLGACGSALEGRECRGGRERSTQSQKNRTLET